MRQTFRADLDLRIGLIFLILFGLCLLRSVLGAPQLPNPRAILFDGISVYAAASFILSALFTRVTATQEGIAAFNFLNLRKFFLPYDDITLYAYNGASWYMRAGTARLSLPLIDYDDLHRVMVERAPAALRAKRWRCGQLPPAEDFKNLSGFDPLNWLIGLGIALGTASMFVLLSHPLLPLWMVGGLCLGPVADIRELFWRISICADGLESKTPWRIRTIRWDEVTAVFCQKRGIRRVFVLTSGTTSIHIPAHIARELDPMRKLFYSLPDGTKCVNFDEKFGHGFRRRKRRPAQSINLETAFEF